VEETQPNQAVQGELEAMAQAEDRLSVWAKNQTELAEALGCDRKTIQRWVKSRDADCPGAMADGRYNVTLWKLWVANKGKKPAKRRLDDKVDLDKENTRLRNEKLEIENAVRRGQLMDVDEVCKVITEMVSGFVKRVRGSKHTLAPQVTGVSVPEATKRIGREVEEALNELALGDWAQKKTFWSIVSATLSDLRKRHNLGDGLNDT
jgi:hypothetical protein